jgi:hypothetical protein
VKVGDLVQIMPPFRSDLALIVDHTAWSDMGDEKVFIIWVAGNEATYNMREDCLELVSS